MAVLISVGPIEFDPQKANYEERKGSQFPTTDC